MPVHSAPIMPVQSAQWIEHSAIMPVHTLLLTFLPFPSNCSSQAPTLFLKQGKGINLQNNQNDKSISCLIITNTIACISFSPHHCVDWNDKNDNDNDDDDGNDDDDDNEDDEDGDEDFVGEPVQSDVDDDSKDNDYYNDEGDDIEEDEDEDFVSEPVQSGSFWYSII